VKEERVHGANLERSKLPLFLNNCYNIVIMPKYRYAYVIILNNNDNIVEITKVMVL
jgi:hypothetical protein